MLTQYLLREAKLEFPVKTKNKADYFNEQLPPDQSESSCNWTNRKFV